VNFPVYETKEYELVSPIKISSHEGYTFNCAGTLYVTSDVGSGRSKEPDRFCFNVVTVDAMSIKISRDMMNNGDIGCVEWSNYGAQYNADAVISGLIPLSKARPIASLTIDVFGTINIQG